MKILSSLMLTAVATTCFGQQPNVANQREAMKKLNFLVGSWTGDATVNGPSGEIKLVQTESVQWKLGGLVMLIEGASRRPTGEIAFQALATVGYDDATGTYHFRAYNDGRYLDTELKLAPNGFSWGFEAGPAKITNEMTLDEKGEWVETTQMTAGQAPPRTLVRMLLHRNETNSGNPAAIERFDGDWQTTLSCEPSRGALGFSYRFLSQVRNGQLRGLYGTEGQPSSLLIEGKLAADGAANLYATGQTGGKEFVPGRDTPRGTRYNYNIHAHFEDRSGSGTRVEGRPCSYRFEKQ